MCGRGTLTKVEAQLEMRFDASFYSDELERYNPLPNFNVAPTHRIPVMTADDPHHLQLMHWGLIPSWAKDKKMAARMINARIETVLQKPAFRSAIRKRRCVALLDGYYEWQKSEEGKQPFWIGHRDGDTLMIAGIWETWHKEENPLKSVSLLTRSPEENIAHLHDRMPVLLTDETVQYWLDQEAAPETVLEAVKSYPAEQLHYYPVSKRVNKVQENDEQLLAPIDLSSGAQRNLFGQ